MWKKAENAFLQICPVMQNCLKGDGPECVSEEVLVSFHPSPAGFSG